MEFLEREMTSAVRALRARLEGLLGDLGHENLRLLDRELEGYARATLTKLDAQLIEAKPDEQLVFTDAHAKLCGQVAVLKARLRRLQEAR